MDRRYRFLVLTGVLAMVTSCKSESGITASAIGNGSLANQKWHAKDRPTPGSTTVLSVDGCNFTVTYEWSDQKGSELTARLGLYEQTNGPDAVIEVYEVAGKSGFAGSASNTFSLIADVHAGRTIVARGILFDTQTGQEVGSSSAASESVASRCG